MMPSAWPLSELDVPGAPLVKSCAYQPPARSEKPVTQLRRARCSASLGAGLRTLGKEAVLIQHGGRVEEQQHRDTQVEEGHQAPLAKASPTWASFGLQTPRAANNAAAEGSNRATWPRSTAGGKGRALSPCTGSPRGRSVCVCSSSSSLQCQQQAQTEWLSDVDSTESGDAMRAFKDEPKSCNRARPLSAAGRLARGCAALRRALHADDAAGKASA